MRSENIVIKWLIPTEIKIQNLMFLGPVKSAKRPGKRKLPFSKKMIRSVANSKKSTNMLTELESGLH